MTTPKFTVGQRVKHHRVKHIVGTVTAVIDRETHPAAPGWWYTIDVDNRPDRPEWARTFSERVLEEV